MQTVIKMEYDEEYGLIITTKDGKKLVLKFYDDASGAICDICWEIFSQKKVKP